MKLSRFSLLLALVFFACEWCLSQSAAYVPGQLLVSLQAEDQPAPLLRHLRESTGIAATVEKKVSGLLNVWSLHLAPEKEQAALEWLVKQPEVRYAQFNYFLNQRATAWNNILPDDPYLAQQWQYMNNGANGGVPGADLDAELAWNIATGGLSPAGDTIVVAVIDGGIDTYHGDLAENLWRNSGEIPGDLIDNDGNGYVDDHAGWNVIAGNDDIAGGSTGHGTSVSAVIGAKGNNEKGVTGVNWDVKIMFVAGGNTIANILSAYDYIIAARNRYNASGGEQGAFVVALNCSWGINYGQPADAPLWCAAFDSLGKAGILSVASTANIPIDVDEFGDLPTACSSDYLVTVTSLNNADQKAPLAAWGATTIDLGAYGQDIFSTGANEFYGNFSGTSYAAPQVSGAIGLLYSAPCPNLAGMARSNPGAAALYVKNLLLNSVTPNNALQGITLTGGRLNLYSFLQDYEDQCSPCPAPFAAAACDITGSSASLTWSVVSAAEKTNLHYRPLGASTWTTVSDAFSPFLLEGLNACTVYEFALSAYCDPGGASDWSTTTVFETDGCCEPPAALQSDAITPTAATLSWNAVTAADNYRLNVRETPSGAWQQYELFATSLVLQDLSPCTFYEVRVQTHCDTGWTVSGDPHFFETAGCGSCTDMAYCPASALHSEEEWIASVQIGNWQHDSGYGSTGYENFTGTQQSVLYLVPQSTEPVTVIPGFSGLPYKEYFRIYVDFNMDGDFGDPGEKAFDPGWATDGPISGQLVVPDFTTPGLTRMRVMMKFKNGNTPPPQPCEVFEFGQVEDYCVQLQFPVGIAETGSSRPNSLFIYPQPAADVAYFRAPDDATFGGDWFVTVQDVAGRTLFSGMIASGDGTVALPCSGWPAGVYAVRAEQAGSVYGGRLVKI